MDADSDGFLAVEEMLLYTGHTHNSNSNSNSNGNKSDNSSFSQQEMFDTLRFDLYEFYTHTQPLIKSI